MKELIELTDKWRIASFQPRDENGTDADEYKKHQMQLCADELLAVLEAMKPRPIEEAPKGERILLKTKTIGWVESWFDENLSAWETYYGWIDDTDIEGWLPLPTMEVEG